MRILYALLAIGLLCGFKSEAKDLTIRIAALDESFASGFYSGLPRERAVTRPDISKVSNFAAKLKWITDNSNKKIKILEVKTMKEENIALNSKLKFGSTNVSVKLEHKAGIVHLVSRSGKDEPIVFDKAEDLKLSENQTFAINSGLQVKNGDTYYNIIIFISK